MGLSCEHCWPTKRRTHIHLHIEYYAWKLMTPLRLISRGLVSRHGSNHVAGFVFRLLSALGLVHLEQEPDESKIYNRSLIFFHEAKRRGLDIRAMRVFKNYPHEFLLILDGRKYYFEGTPLHIFGQDERIDEKNLVKSILERQGIPVPLGKSFLRLGPALAFARKIGFPLIVKPNSGSLSHHVTYPINSEDELQSAIKIAKIYQPEFVVERFIKGSLYRVSVLGKETVFACRKDAASVTGDGMSTIQKLIEAKNAESRRGKTDQRNTTLHEIPTDDMLDENLSLHGLTRSSVPDEGMRVPLHKKCVLSHGCDITNCSDNIHPENKELCLKIARIFNTEIIGIDLICENISIPYQEQSFGVIETNSLPYVDMHACPSHGIPDPVAETGWDIVMKRLASSM